MKRTLSLLLIFLLTFLGCQLFIPYTLMQQESYALFLTTPDYLRETFSAPWPVSHLVGNFIVQFFHYPYAGPAIMALLVTLLFFLISLVGHGRARTLCALVFAAMVTGGGIVLATSKPVRTLEARSAAEYYAEHHDWPRVLAVATPQATRRDRELLPYALLALTESGQLPQKMFLYPIRSDDDFCPEGWQTRRGLTFGAILYECMGVTNEAIHRRYQAADALPHGTSFGTLRSLTRLYRLQGNALLAAKYHTILAHSTLHSRSLPPSPSQGGGALRKLDSRHLFPAQGRKNLLSYAMLRYTTKQNSPSLGGGLGEAPSEAAPLITPDYFYNITSLIAHGQTSRTLIDRSLCALLARRDLNHFLILWNQLPHPDGEDIPAHYREALLLAQPDQSATPPHGPYADYYFRQP